MPQNNLKHWRSQILPIWKDSREIRKDVSCIPDWIRHINQARDQNKPGMN